MSELQEDLMIQYMYQKEKTLEKFNVKLKFDRDKASRFMHQPLEKMAEVVVDWDFSPALMMEAVFDYARSNKHYNGPQPNMFGSRKYITNALVYYLGIPYELAAQKQCRKFWLEKIDEHFNDCVKSLQKSEDNIAFATSIPVEYRFVYGVANGFVDKAASLSRDVMRRVDNDKKVLQWLEHRGVTYQALAKLHKEVMS
jgi:hypothetical protein